MLVALTRAVPPSIVRCELTHRERTPIDVALAVEQHAVYEQTLTELGCRVVHVDPEPEMPDSVFIEDTAIVLDEVAIITRPGAQSRRGETAGVAKALREYREVATIEAPATIDGGDVLVAGMRIFVGLSSRTNQEAVRQLRGMPWSRLSAGGRDPRRLRAGATYEVIPVELRGILHLKSAVTCVGDRWLLINRQHVDDRPFRDFDLIDADDANALLVNGVAVVSSEATARALNAHGIETRLVPNGELAKAEGGVTCCSLIFSAAAASR
jgi:dimethylargininase